MYDVVGVAEILGITTHKVEQWRKEGKLQALRAGRLYRYSEAELRRFTGLDCAGVFFPNEICK
jgi:excisionase family DNA binding protein